MELWLWLAGCATGEGGAPGMSGVAAAKVDSSDSSGDSGWVCDAPRGEGSGDSGGIGTGHGSLENDPYDPDSFDDVKNCAGCHPEHYDEWHGSTHAYAATNPVMWAGSEHVGLTTSEPRFCVGCHAPIATLTASVPPNVVLDGITDLPAAAQRGVSCTTCHRLYDVYNGVNQFTQCADYYFGSIEDPVAGGYHGSEYDDLHTQALACRSCHNVENLQHVQVEFTYSEWDLQNRLLGGTDEAPAIQTCQDCHMPAYDGKAAVGGPDRTVHRHRFVGGEVPLVPFPDSHRHFREVEALMRTAAEIEIAPELSGGWLMVGVQSLVEGHSIPTGTSFNRQVWVELYVTGADGTLYLSSGDLDAQGDLRDENSALEPGGDPYMVRGGGVFRSYLTDSADQPTFDFASAAAHYESDTLGPLAARDILYDVGSALPESPAWPISVEARLLYRPYAPFLLRSMALDNYIAALPVVEIATATQSLAAPAGVQ